MYLVGGWDEHWEGTLAATGFCMLFPCSHMLLSSSPTNGNLHISPLSAYGAWLSFGKSIHPGSGIALLHGDGVAVVVFWGIVCLYELWSGDVVGVVTGTLYSPTPLLLFFDFFLPYSSMMMKRDDGDKLVKTRICGALVVVVWKW